MRKFRNNTNRLFCVCVKVTFRKACIGKATILKREFNIAIIFLSDFLSVVFMVNACLQYLPHSIDGTNNLGSKCKML